jgi:hypothetical protein
MNRLTALAAATALCAASVSSMAQTAAPAAKAAPKPATSHQKLKSEAAGMALATETAQAASQNQLDIAARVLTGKADCEFNQHVDVEPLHGKPGYFKVAFKNASYTMAPEETTTGAVRLEDKKSGMVWIQIPSKSMLMNSKAGQRMVDGCTQSEQRAAVEAAKAAAKTTKQ